VKRGYFWLADPYPEPDVQDGFFWDLSALDLSKDAEEFRTLSAPERQVFRRFLQFDYGMRITEHPLYRDLDTDVIVEIAGFAADRYDDPEARADFWFTVQECASTVLKNRTQH
jgi:hypothetical protein